MAGVLPLLPRFQFSDASGVPLSGGSVDVYLAGTTTRTNTWQDKTQLTLNTNPIVLDASGGCTIWCDPDLTYKLVVKNAAGVTQSHLGGDNILIGGQAPTVAEFTVDRFSGDGSQTVFTLSTTPQSENNTQVYVSGVYQQKNTYSLSGTSLTFASAPASGTNNIEVTTLDVTDYTAVAASIEGSLDSIAYIYPDLSVSDPTTRPDGSAIQEGDTYTSTGGITKRYVSSAWVSVTAASTADLANASDAAKGGALVGFSPTVAYSSANTVASALKGAGLGTVLSRASSPSLPLMALTPPADFNDQLNLNRVYDGVAARYLQDPYDVIDFTKNPDTTINHYYVDYVNGNDANAGTSAGSGNAWKTLGKANTSAVSPAVIHLMDEWVGYQNRAANYTWNGKFKFVSGHSSGVTRLQGTRESYTKATFAWTDEGGGCWSTSTATTTSAIFGALGSAMFDAKYLDADGVAMPIPDVGSSAACIATPGSQYHDSVNSKKWVHLIDGRQPDPYDGWIYCQAGTSWQDQQSSDTGVLLYENLHCYMNLGSSTTAVFRYRHSTTATNNSVMGKKNCICAGGSGNNFETYDAKVVVMSGCVSKYARADGFNYHTFQTTGTDGEYMTVYEYNCKGSTAGYASGWYNQPALGTSANASTAHDSMHIERMNCDHVGGNGATIADVNGCVSVNWCVNAGPATGTGSPKACFWHEKLNWAGSASGMYLWGCSAHDGDDGDVLLLTNQAQSGGSANDGQIYVKYWRGQTTGDVTGTVKKFDGTNW